jgi:hypothetical protein
MRRTGELLPRMMRALEAVWPEVATDMEIRASVAPLLFEIASAQALDEAYTRRLQRRIEELEAIRAETPTATVPVINVFQTINNNVNADHHVTINDSFVATDNAMVGHTTINPPAKQPAMTIDRAIAVFVAILTILQTYAALRPDEPAKPPQAQEQTRPARPEIKPGPADPKPR